MNLCIQCQGLLEHEGKEEGGNPEASICSADNDGDSNNEKKTNTRGVSTHNEEDDVPLLGVSSHERQGRLTHNANKDNSDKYDKMKSLSFVDSECNSNNAATHSPVLLVTTATQPPSAPLLTTRQSSTYCVVCLGIFESSFAIRLKQELWKAVRPYYDHQQNHSNDDAPTSSTSTSIGTTTSDVVVNNEDKLFDCNDKNETAAASSDSNIEGNRLRTCPDLLFSQIACPPALSLPGDVLYRYKAAQHRRLVERLVDDKTSSTAAVVGEGMSTSTSTFSNTANRLDIESNSTTIIASDTNKNIVESSSSSYHSINNTLSTKNSSTRGIISQSLTMFSQAIKQYTKNKLLECLAELSGNAIVALNDDISNKETKQINGDNDNDDWGDYPPCVQQEEQGYLSVYVLVSVHPDIVRPWHTIQQTKGINSNYRKRRRNQHNQIQDNGEWIHHQGGDPRVNLESRVVSTKQQQQKDDEGGDHSHNHEKNHRIVLWTFNQALESGLPLDMNNDNHLLQPLTLQATHVDPWQIHVAVWRRPFYLRGLYTKTRRDVSQTPFHVVQRGVSRRLGVTSVEEQIVPVISHYCGGISVLNNDSTVESSNVRYGLVKFHASGREDMDVRMLLPPPLPSHPVVSNEMNHNHNDMNVSGRPFVCEVIDAMRLVRPKVLADIVNKVNQCNEPISLDGRSFGQHPMGVGISPALNFVPSSSFKNLQTETESKIKYYGCLCWSEEPWPNQDALNEKLKGLFPLVIEQRTPIRVLHRRTNMIRIRHVLTCHTACIDEHYFRVHMSTDAGTYVKEFCHGDLGRTVPNLSTLLGCKIDILELDCEGIQAN